MSKDVQKIIGDYELQDRIKTWIKDTIFKILTTDLHWRPYGVSLNSYQMCRSLDDYILKVTNKLYQQLQPGVVCSNESWSDRIRIEKYIPSIETMDSNDADML